MWSALFFWAGRTILDGVHMHGHPRLGIQGAAEGS
ncbi:hypothetical protein BJ998_004184 [Kutzneria kofuensis]|uniref:Uncharacterized protein n=1 Tax=Kutzneria kofuensis TaxID=103725 RepID=A0A7W9NIC6_9PSEU|nr:hypothetical protein [Kutzneria kofuensis]